MRLFSFNSTCGLVVLYLVCIVLVSCQTFQYSKGWTNGRKRASSDLYPEDNDYNIPSRAISAAMLNKGLLNNLLGITRDNRYNKRSLRNIYSENRQRTDLIPENLNSPELEI